MVNPYSKLFYSLLSFSTCQKMTGPVDRLDHRPVLFLAEDFLDWRRI